MMCKSKRWRAGVVGVAIAYLVWGVWSLALSAQPSFGPSDREEFAARRARLFEQIADGIAVVLAEEEHPYAVKFHQSPDFYYLTGIEEPGAILLLVGPKKQSFVFAHKRSPNKVRFEGPGLLDLPNPSETYGLTQAQPIESFLSLLNAAVPEAQKLYVHLTPPDSLQMSRGETRAKENSLARHPLYQYTPLVRQAVSRLRELQPNLQVADIAPLLDTMRWIKTPYEIERLRKSGQIGAEGYKEAMKGTRPGMYEYEIEAALRFFYAKLGARQAFIPIVASGPNMLVWHYMANDRQMQAGEIVLMDAGAEYEYYTSDITRTWPVSGRFTPEQEKIYRCVLEARDAIIAAMKPGVTIRQLQDVGEEVFKRHGYHKEFMNLGRYVGHPVGLSVHDVSPSGRQPLQAGVVFNVEPILEIPEKKIHMRLEDTVLVTPTGAENLTAGLPAEPEAIYALIKQKGIGGK